MFRKSAFVVLALASLISVFCVGEEGKYGGTLRVATVTPLPSIDWQNSTADACQQVMWHVYEGLVEYNSEFVPSPMLAQSWESNEDFTRWTFHLRQGVMFHNGDVMDAWDVKASIERFQRGYVGDRLKGITVNVLDSYTVEFVLEEPNTVLPGILANFHAHPCIMPKEIAETVPPGELKPPDVVGTGPYRLVEWKPGVRLVLERFENYTPNTNYTGWDGVAGYKIPYIERIEFYPVSEPTVRVAGLLAGEYDFICDIPGLEYQRLKDDPNIVTLRQGGSYPCVLLNVNNPPLDNLLVRRAIQVGIDIEEIGLAASQGVRDLFALDGHLMTMVIKRWYWDGWKDLGLYNQADTERARSLLEEAGYAGEEIVFLTNHSSAIHFRSSVAMLEQLKNLGLNVIMEVYDWPGSLAKRGDLTAWHLFQTGMGFMTEPTNYDMIWSGHRPSHCSQWWGDEEVYRYWCDALKTADFEEQYQLYEKLWERVYYLAPFVKLQEVFTVYAHTKDLKDYRTIGMIAFWNAWLEDRS